MPNDPKTLARRYYEEFLTAPGNLDLADEILAPDVVFHNPLSTDPVRGIAEYKNFAHRWYVGIPDRLFTVDDVVGEGETVAVRFTITGTHLGEFLGAQPTGNRIRVNGMNLFRTVGGKIKDVQAFFNPLELYQPVGVPLPPVPPA